MALVDKELRELSDLPRLYFRFSDERRFLRRIIRDHEERGSNVSKTSSTNISRPFSRCITKSFIPSRNYADVIVNNDGVENFAVEVLTCVVKRATPQSRIGRNGTPSDG
jgi:uridine kinase